MCLFENLLTHFRLPVNMLQSRTGPFHRVHCKRHYYSLLLLLFTTRTREPHGPRSLHAKQQVHASASPLEKQRMQTSVKAARPFVQQRSKMLHNVRTFRKFCKISANSYKNKPGEGGSYIPSSTASPPVMLSAGSSGWIGQWCVCVLFMCVNIS